jgi:hypothetical protein
MRGSEPSVSAKLESLKRNGERPVCPRFPHLHREGVYRLGQRHVPPQEAGGDGAGVTATVASITAPAGVTGAAPQPTGIEWARREIMIFVAGPIAERITCRRETVERVVAVHEAGHVVVQFLLGKRLAGASIVPWPGHSLGRAASRKPTPEDFKEPPTTDEQMASGLAHLGGLDRAQIEASTEALLADHWPLVRRLADVLVERKVISARRARRLLYKAQPG